MKSQWRSLGVGRRSGGFSFAIGSRKRQRLAEYPCVSRLRQRRLILFLFSHDFVQTHDAFMDETAWRSTAGGPTPSSTSPASCRPTVRSDRFATESPALLKLRTIFSSLLESKTLRESLDMARVRWEASSTVDDLLYQTPELKDHLRPCRRGSMNPQSVLPLRFGQASFRQRRHMKKQGGRVPASVVAGLYLQKKKMLPSSTPSDSQGLTREALVKAKEWLVDLVDKSVEAGKLRQGDPVRRACGKGAPGQQTCFGTRPRPDGRSRYKIVTNIAMLKEAMEWILYLNEERLENWPEMSHSSEPGDFSARLSKIVPGAFTRPAGSLEVLRFPQTQKQALEIFRSNEAVARTLLRGAFCGTSFLAN